MSVSLTEEYSLQIFHMLDFSFVASLDFVGGQSVNQGAFIACSNSQICVRPSFLVDIKFSHRPCHGCEERFLPLVPSSTLFYRRLVPVDEMSLVLFGSCPHPFGSPSSRCLSQRLFLTSSGWDLFRVGIC